MRAMIVFLGLIMSALAGHGQASQPPLRMPSFRFYDAETGSTFTEKNLKPDVATVVLFFDPTCDHCQLQAQWIGGARFTQTQFLWITTDTRERTLDFRRAYLPKTAAPMYWVLDKDYRVDDYFGYSTVPSVYLYDASGKLLQTFRNEVAASELQRYVH